METLKFSRNWNRKLLCQYFTTLRLTSKKYTAGARFCVRVEDDPFFLPFTAEVVSTRQLKSWELTNEQCFLDTGLNKEKTIGLLSRFYQKTGIPVNEIDFSLIMLRRLES